MLKFYVSMGCLFIFTSSLFCYSPDAVAGHEIIGAPKCKSCHKSKTGDQWKIWTESAHARAYQTLATENAIKIAADKGLGNPQQEESCLKCHATKAFLGTGVVVSGKANYTDSEGVGCEACHGPGSDYKPGKVMNDPEAARAAGMLSDRSADACVRCHNEESPTFKGFDFEARWSEISHQVPSEEGTLSGSLSDSPAMPDEITFKSSIGNVHFPHDLHVEDLELECTECHHQIHAVELDTPHPDYMKSSWVKCRVCHDSDSKMSQKYYKCSDCHHSDLEDIADETLSSKVVIHQNCWSCHDAGTGVTASIACIDCHVDEEIAELALKNTP